jgi:cyanoexosortase A
MMKMPAAAQLTVLLRRIPPSTPRNLWLLTAGVVAFHNLWVIHATQEATALLVFSLLCWWGALTCMEDRLESLRPHPSRSGMVLGTLVLAWCLIRSSLILDRDAVIYALAPLEVISLALLCVPIRQIRAFWHQIVILSLVPLSLIGQNIYPERLLSVATATMASILLSVVGFDVTTNERVVTISRVASVSVLKACSGYEQIAQVISIAIIFLLAFPLQDLRNKTSVLALAPVIAIVSNTFRVALLTLIIYAQALTGSENQWWFDFFHDGEGSLVFSGIAVCIFSWFYLKVLDKELGPPPPPTRPSFTPLDR